jgi:uncharacterized membrane protein YdbT with pleckstrin-like domain
MTHGLAKGAFFTTLAIVALVLVLAIYQVPQPWRGILVGWVLFLTTVGVFVLRLARHFCDYKALQLSARQLARREPPVRHARRTSNPRVDSLKVVLSDSAGSGRRTIR